MQLQYGHYLKGGGGSDLTQMFEALFFNKLHISEINPMVEVGGVGGGQGPAK